MKTTKPASSSRISGSRSTRAIPGSKALKSISDKALISSIRKLSYTERKTVLEILVHLIEIDRRKLYLPRGYSSLYEFCTGYLGYSESTAVRRIRVARLVRDFPESYRLLASGRIAMSNVVKISGVIDAANAEELLSEIEGRSAREVDLIVSRQRPKSSIRDRVSPVYVRTVLQISSDDTGGRQDAGPKGGKKFTVNVDGKKPATSGEPAVERRMVLEQRFKVEFGVDQEFLEKLERVRSLLSTKHHAKLEFEELFEILMDEYIDRHSPEGRIRRKTEREWKKAERDQRKVEKRPKEVATPTPADLNKRKEEISRHIPKSVRDEVYARDRGRCTFLAPGGKRCGSKWDLQIDHIVPFARGGDNSPSNLRLLCAKHNRLEAEGAFGEKHMEQFCDP